MKWITKLTEGKKMFFTVLTIFLLYAGFFLVFDDFDRSSNYGIPSHFDWHLLIFAIILAIILGYLLLRYARRMDERIAQEQEVKQAKTRRELTQNIGHEFKTPVASIMGYTETLLENPNIDEDLKRRFLERTLAQSQRLSALLQDISILNRMDYASEVLTRERVDVSKLVAEVVQESALAVYRKHMIVKNYLPSSVVVRGNNSLLYSVFRNLLDNSINYAGDGATVEIDVHDHDKYWEFTFSDNGQGIDAKHLKRIFERFYRVDKGRSRELGGTGLGLAIVKNAVEQHGGTITASIPDTGGLKYTFTLSKR